VKRWDDKRLGPIRVRRVRHLVGALLAFSLIGSGFTAPVSAAEPYDILVSTSANRSNPVPLAGRSVSGSIFAFAVPETGVTRVLFWLDNAQMTGAPTKTEGNPPYDFAGTATNGTANPYDTTKLPDGAHSITARFDLPDGTNQVVTSTFTVNNGVANPYDLKVSTSPNRSGAVSLNGQTVSNNIYVFSSPTAGVSRVRFWLDNPSMTGTPTKIEKGAPFDFAGTETNGTAKPFNTTTLSDGPHSITASIEPPTGTPTIITANFTVDNSNVPALSFSSPSKTFETDVNGSAPNQTVDLTASDASAASFTLNENAPWLAVTPQTGTTPATITLSVDTTGLGPGTYTTTVTASASGYVADTLQVTLEIGGGCSPLACEEILVDIPYQLDFAADHGKILDAIGVGTGFTYVDKPSKGQGYLPDKLNVDLNNGTLNVTTTKGLAYQAANSQDNALGVGIDAPSQVTLLNTTITDPPAGTGSSEQAGLWFGNDEDNFVKLVILSTGTGTKVQYAMEVGGSQVASRSSQVITGLSGGRIKLQLRADPSDRTITGSYSVNGGTFQQLAPSVAPDEFFSFDAAGIDPRIGTRSFGGVFASHRNGPAPLVYKFDDFSVLSEGTTPPPPPFGGINFDRTSYAGVMKPTSMAWGPDNRLYVTELFGEIHALTFDANKQVIADQSITTLGSRLTLGITIDPASTPSNVILVVSHSNPSVNEGEPNTSTITRLSGPGFGTRQDVITGLPRAIANHAVNSIHFGPDGKLYIAQGGNTGAGAPNTANTEFGTMSEQPLSAALLVADVNAAGFDGSCHNAADIFGPPPCDVTPYATGLRNMYDFVIHSNGQMYGPDNGLGVTGSFPPSPTPPCKGLASTAPWNQGGHNPGRQPDLFMRLQQGKYYGHPNPYRNECVFKDGSYQGVAPLPNYVPPMHNLGNNRSANGTIEYTSDAFCGDLQGQVLMTNYSVGDDISRIKLSSDGLSVQAYESLVGGFDDPLPIAQGPDGSIYVGEFGGNLVTALEPVDVGCWTAKASMPAPVLDAGGTAVNGKMYMVAGKNASTHLSSMYIYDPVADSWTTGPSLPGPGVENPAATALNGKLYVFGGSTGPFSGAVTNAAVYDPTTNRWSSLPPMSTPRAGATAQTISGKIYVAGGMDASGASLATAEVFNPSTNSWSSVASMSTRRDNLASANIGGKMYVFGGRTRNADGTVVDDTLASVEMYDPATNTWTGRASMPTGRRTMVVGLLNGKVQVIGGERKPDGTAFAANEEYDATTDTWRALKPITTGRHGAVAATINGVIYVAGGATDAAANSVKSVNEAFTFSP
jgi:N-acetylneuraminic acid mutarotase/glucose/arabinose dehydrogenase